MSAWHSASRTIGWWVAALLGLATVAAYVGGHLHHGTLDGKTIYFALTMSIGMLVGLWAWAWRPKTHMGPLMFWWPALWLASDLPTAYPSSSVASTIGLALFVMGPIVFAQMALSYPTGKLMPLRLAWVYIFILGYLAQGIQNLVNMLFWDLSGCPVCPPPREPTVIHVGDAPFSLQAWNDAWLVFVLVILPIGLYLLVRRYVGASPGARRSIGPVLATSFVITCTSWVSGYAALTDRFTVLTPLSWVQTTGALVAAFTAVFGLLVTRRTRGAVGDLVVELDRAGPGEVRDALARAIGDPTLELALWLPDRQAWADESGAEVVLPASRDRAVTFVGSQLAAMIHDPVLLDQPALLEAAGSAAHLALENERLQAELRAQLAELRESRARIVRAGDDERRRLERDLHDGAQQRLLGIGMGLQLLRSRLGGDAETAALLDETEVEVQGALRELRELARGIHPAVLTDQGLGAAIWTLAERAPIPVEIQDSGERLPPHVETAIYFLVAEALTNVARHAHGSRAWVSVEPRGDVVVVEVRDDGVGGAALDGGGSGLRGLADRVGALDGTLRVESPPGRGTCLHAEIPCGS
jgi:signal transduction histidine kinase